MRFYKYSYEPGESRQVAARGSFVRGISGSKRYQIQIDDGPATEFETGLAFHPREPFSSIRVTNTAAVTQIIEIAISEGQLDDNRMVGKMDLNGAIGILTTAAFSHTTHPVQTLADTTPTEVLPANSDRRAATVWISEDCYIDDAVNGVLIPAGRFVWEAQTPITLAADTAPCEVRILEESNV
jgi:hypothetical protein